MNKKYFLSLAALSALSFANVAQAARDNGGNRDCGPTPPATCYPDDCRPCHCLGPENYGVNAPVGPKTCNGDLAITVAGFYWNAHQDGMEYAIDNEAVNPSIIAGGDPDLADIQTLNTLIDAEYLTPNFKWNFGFKIGLGYTTTCDGWDIGVLWTSYHGKGHDEVEAEADDNHTLLPLWSAFAPAQGSVVYATDIETNWKLRLNLVDIELGRSFWTSKHLSIRPHVGVRISFIDQKFEIENKGGSWSTRTDPDQDALNNEVNLQNTFKGAGVRAGLDSVWNFGCGWAIYGNLAASLVYGRFHVTHDEDNRQAIAPHAKTKVLETTEGFRASRGMLDLALGIQWSTMFCDCQYAFTFMLGWEQHLFFGQNQFWRVNRIGDVAGVLPNNTGENIFAQSRGDLDTEGWTLTVKFEF